MSNDNFASASDFVSENAFTDGPIDFLNTSTYESRRFTKQSPLPYLNWMTMNTVSLHSFFYQIYDKKFSIEDVIQFQNTSSYQNLIVNHTVGVKTGTDAGHIGSLFIQGCYDLARLLGLLIKDDINNDFKNEMISVFSKMPKFMLVSNGVEPMGNKNLDFVEGFKFKNIEFMLLKYKTKLFDEGRITEQPNPENVWNSFPLMLDYMNADFGGKKFKLHDDIFKSANLSIRLIDVPSIIKNDIKLNNQEFIPDIYGNQNIPLEVKEAYIGYIHFKDFIESNEGFTDVNLLFNFPSNSIDNISMIDLSIPYHLPKNTSVHLHNIPIVGTEGNQTEVEENTWLSLTLDLSVLFHEILNQEKTFLEYYEDIDEVYADQLRNRIEEIELLSRGVLGSNGEVDKYFYLRQSQLYTDKIMPDFHGRLYEIKDNPQGRHEIGNTWESVFSKYNTGKAKDWLFQFGWMDNGHQELGATSDSAGEVLQLPTSNLGTYFSTLDDTKIKQREILCYIIYIVNLRKPNIPFRVIGDALLNAEKLLSFLQQSNNTYTEEKLNIESGEYNIPVPNTLCPIFYEASLFAIITDLLVDSTIDFAGISLLSFFGFSNYFTTPVTDSELEFGLGLEEIMSRFKDVIAPSYSGQRETLFYDMLQFQPNAELWIPSAGYIEALIIRLDESNKPTTINTDWIDEALSFIDSAGAAVEIGVGVGARFAIFAGDFTGKMYIKRASSEEIVLIRHGDIRGGVETYAGYEMGASLGKKSSKPKKSQDEIPEARLGVGGEAGISAGAYITFGVYEEFVFPIKEDNVSYALWYAILQPLIKAAELASPMTGFMFNYGIKLFCHAYEIDPYEYITKRKYSLKLSAEGTAKGEFVIGKNTNTDTYLDRIDNLDSNDSERNWLSTSLSGVSLDLFAAAEIALTAEIEIEYDRGDSMPGILNPEEFNKTHSKLKISSLTNEENWENNSFKVIPSENSVYRYNSTGIYPGDYIPLNSELVKQPFERDERKKRKILKTEIELKVEYNADLFGNINIPLPGVKKMLGFLTRSSAAFHSGMGLAVKYEIDNTDTGLGFKAAFDWDSLSDLKKIGIYSVDGDVDKPTEDGYEKAVYFDYEKINNIFYILGDIGEEIYTFLGNKFEEEIGVSTTTTPLISSDWESNVYKLFRAIIEGIDHFKYEERSSGRLYKNLRPEFFKQQGVLHRNSTPNRTIKEAIANDNIEKNVSLKYYIYKKAIFSPHDVFDGIMRIFIPDYELVDNDSEVVTESQYTEESRIQFLVNKLPSDNENPSAKIIKLVRGIIGFIFDFPIGDFTFTNIIDVIESISIFKDWSIAALPDGVYEEDDNEEMTEEVRELVEDKMIELAYRIMYAYNIPVELEVGIQASFKADFAFRIGAEVQIGVNFFVEGHIQFGLRLNAFQIRDSILRGLEALSHEGLDPDTVSELEVKEYIVNSINSDWTNDSESVIKEFLVTSYGTEMIKTK